MSESRFNAWRARVLLFLIFLVPLFYLDPYIFGISFPDSFGLPKRYLVELVSLILLILCVLDLSAGGELRIPARGAAIPLLLFCAWTCVSLVWAPSLHDAWKEVIRWACYGIIFLSAAESLSRPPRARSVARCVLASVSIVSAIAIAQFYGLDHPAFIGQMFRVYSTLGNPNYIASFLAVTLPLAYWGWLCPGTGRRDTVCLVVSLIGTAALMLTGSRAGVAALCVGSLAGLASSSRVKIAPLRLACLAPAAAALAVLLALPSPINRYDTVTIRKLSELSGAPRGGAGWRMLVWEIGLRMAAGRPLLGSGAGSFKLLYLPRQAEFLSEPGHAGAISLAEGGIDFAHNDYLETLIETGAVGLAIFLWMLLAIVRPLRREQIKSQARGHLWRGQLLFCHSGESRNPDIYTSKLDPCFRRDDIEKKIPPKTDPAQSRLPDFKSQSIDPGWIRAGAYAGCVSMLADALVGFPFRLWAPAAVFFALSGSLGAGDGTPLVFRIKGRVTRIAAGIALAPVALISLGFILFSLLAEIHYARGFNLFQYGETTRACDEFTLATGWQPHHGRARFFRGLCFSARAEYGNALDEIRESRRTYARQALYVQEGRLLGKLGRREEAVRELDLASAIVPRDPDAWVEKGAVLFASGDMPGAAECYRRALSLKPDSLTAARNLAVSYDALGRTAVALRLYTRAMEIGPADADVYVNAGTLWARKGDARRARELWEKALVIDPGNTRARLNLERLDKSPPAKR